MHYVNFIALKIYYHFRWNDVKSHFLLHIRRVVRRRHILYGLDAELDIRMNNQSIVIAIIINVITIIIIFSVIIIIIIIVSIITLIINWNNNNILAIDPILPVWH